MKPSELGRIIEQLGQDIVRYDRKSMEAYQARDFEASIRYHEMAIALEKRVAEHLQQPLVTTASSSHSGVESLPPHLSC